MLRYSALAILAGTLSIGTLVTTPASAQGVQIPAGDVLEATPPIDWTPFDVLTAPPRDQRRAYRLQEGRSVAIDGQRRPVRDLGQ